MSPTTKLEVASLAVKVKARVASLEAAPSLTSAAVIASVGVVLSKVQLNCVAAVLALLAPSVKAPLATSIVVAPADAGVNVAV